MLKGAKNLQIRTYRQQENQFMKKHHRDWNALTRKQKTIGLKVKDKGNYVASKNL